MPLWWDQMPQVIRNNIAFKVDHWRKDHSRVTENQAAGRKLAMLSIELRKHRSSNPNLATVIAGARIGRVPAAV